MKAIWNNTVIAESDNTIKIEGNHYFSPDSVKNEYLQESETTTVCPWKGTAGYRHVVVDGKVNSDAAWIYEDPKEEAKEIKGFFAFWKGIEVSE